MIVRELKKQLIQRLVMGGVLSLISLVGYYIIQDYSSQKAEERRVLQNEIVSLNGRIKRFEAMQLEFKESRKLWDRLTDTQKKRNGLDIGVAQQLFEELKEHYLLRNLKVDLSKPEELQDLYKTATTVVESSKVDIVFEGLSDDYVFAFLSAIGEYMPGYITIKSFRIVRDLDVNATVLQKIHEGTSVPMVKGSITLYWRDLKDTAQARK